MSSARQWVPRGLAFGAFAIYAYTAASGTYWLDSGELSAAAFQMGSAHPTGFPLFCWLGRLASLLPIGEIGFRTNLMSGVCAALAVLWGARLILRIAKGPVASLTGAVGGAAALTFSLTFFRQATVTEVYAPNVAVLAGTLLLFAHVLQRKCARYGLWLALAMGLGLSIHITYLFAGPIIVIFLLVEVTRGRKWPRLVPLLTLITCASMYAYLPLRSSTEKTARVDWGHPRTASALAAHISAERPRRAFSASDRVRHSAAAMRSTHFAVIAHNATSFIREIAEQLGPTALLASLFGFGLLLFRRQSRWIGCALIVALLGDTLYSFWLNPMGLVDLQNGVFVLFCLCIGVGIGIAAFANALGKAAAYAGTVATVAIVFPTFDVGWSAVQEASHGDAPRAWAESALSHVPPRGVAIVQNDSTAAGLIFLTTTEAARPDVAVLVRQHLVGDWQRTKQMLDKSDAQCLPHRDPRRCPSNLLSSPSLAAVLQLHRPVAWEIGRDSPPGGLIPGVPLSRISNTPITPATFLESLDVAVFTLSDHSGQPGAMDRAARRVYAVSSVGLGRVAYQSGDLARASGLFDAAVAIRPNHLAGLINRAAVYARQKEFRRAIQLHEQVLSLDPNHVQAHLNIARWKIRLEQDKAAIPHLERALHLDPNHASGWALHALIDLRSGQNEQAEQKIRRAIEIDRHNKDVADLLQQLRPRD